MRLNAYLARAGIASRRASEELIRAGRVTVNGMTAGLATRIEPEDRVEVDGELVEPEPLTFVLLHKPAGVVTTTRDPQGRPTVVGVVGHTRRLVPVGRLDADTTGALLLTNDGELAHRLMHPRFEMDKVYVAEVEGRPTPETLRHLAEGIELEDGRTAPAAGAARRRGPGRAYDPRGAEAPGQADARGSRSPGSATPPQPIRGTRSSRTRSRQMA